MINLLKDVIAVEIAKRVKLDERRTVKYAEDIAAINGDVPPNIDRDGRYHAPHDGYMMPSHYDHLGDPEKVYRKGEYLPTPYWDEEHMMAISRKSFAALMNFQHGKHSIKVKAELAEQAVECKCEAIDIWHSRIWEEDGVKVCYLYLKAGYSTFQKNVYDAIVEQFTYVPEPKEEVVKGDAPVGRVRVKGKLIKTYEVNNNFSYYDDTIVKMLVVLENNSTVYGTMPSGCCVNDKGSMIEFTATFELGKDGDATHAFFKRPSKFVLLETEEAA